MSNMSNILVNVAERFSVPSTPRVSMMRLLVTTTAALLLLTHSIFSSESQSGNKYAIIIAVSQYDNEQFSLPLTANDASALANTLHQRGGFEIIPLYESFDRNVPTSPKTVPTKANIMSETQRVLENCKQGDTVLLYFSGHGYPDRHDPNRTYLLPKDVDVKNIPDTLLETAWLRDLLSRCQATTKFLMIDACHAGGEKSANLDTNSDLQQSKSLSSHELIVGDMAGVVTLASSTKNQLSYFWEEKGMSLFSYWLNEGLKGHADSNGDGEITFNELDEYVNKNVSKTAREVKNVAQTPVRIIGSAVEGVPVVITPRAVSLNVLLDDLAEQIAAAMQVHNVKRTGVLEFSIEQGGRAIERTNNGTLAAYCAEQLEELVKYRLPRRDGFRIIARESVEKALNAKGIGPESLLDSKVSEANITFNDQPLESYVIGTIENRGGEIRLRAVLVSVEDIERLHVARGTATLTESEWGMLGRSVAIPEKAKIPAEVVNAKPVVVVSDNVTVVNPVTFLPPSSGGPQPVKVAYKPVSASLVNWISDNYSQMPHPLRDPNRLLGVEINVQQRIGSGYRNRPLVYKNNEAFAPFRVGDVYQIRLHNAQNEFIAARILVDGLNTLPQDPLPKNTLPQYKFAAIEETDVVSVPPVAESKPVIAPRVNLDSARYWLLPPGFRGIVPGFFETAGSTASYREFRVTTAPRSEAAQQGFTEQIGVITVAYYSTKKIEPPPAETEREKRVRIASMNRRGALGTELGRERTTSLQTRDDLEIDQLLGIVHVYYSDEALAGDSVPPTPSTQSSSTTTESRQTAPVPQRQQTTRRGLFR